MNDDFFESLAPVGAKQSEIDRIINLPIVKVPRKGGKYAGPDLTSEFAREGTGAQFRDVQNWALHVIRTYRKAVLSVGVGHGKTLIGYAVAPVLGIDAARVVILLPAATRATFAKAGEYFASLFHVPAKLTIISYEDLSSPEQVKLLRKLNPSVIFADEAHKLRNVESIRTGRLFSYLDENPETIFIPASGTLYRRSIKDAEPTLRRALRDG
jgi:superfamily II DNA or RNA helicase